MNKRIQDLLEELRDAIHDAIADSGNVAEVMAELELEHCCPAFCVEVTLAEPTRPVNEDEKLTATIELTEYDQQFLQTIKVCPA